MGNYIFVVAGEYVNVGYQNGDSGFYRLRVNGISKLGALSSGSGVSLTNDLVVATNTSGISARVIRPDETSYSAGLTRVYGNILYTSQLSLGGIPLTSNVHIYGSLNEALSDMDDGIWDIPPLEYPITYRLTNCTASSAPVEATVGETVIVSLTFPEGYGVVNPSSDVYVTCNGVLVSSTYSDGQLMFTMPNPS